MHNFSSTCLPYVTVLTAAFGLSCSSAADEQSKATQAEQQANEEISELTRKAKDKAAQVRAEADKEIAEAQADFMQLREDFRHDTNEHLLELDKNIADLEASLATLKGTAKTELDAKLATIREQRKQFANDFEAVASASAVTWDAAKTRAKESLQALERNVKQAD